MDSRELPVGFGLSLAMNPKAMDCFSRMSEDEKQATIEKSRQVTSKREMDRLVSSLAENEERDSFRG